MTPNSRPQLSFHGETRCQQRGIPMALIDALLTHHDVDREIGDGCRALRLSRRFALSRDLDSIDRQDVDRLARLTVIWSDTRNQVVTAFQDPGGSIARRYRSQN